MDLSADAEDQLVADLAKTREADAAEQLLFRAIRVRAASPAGDVVGTDCMSVLLWRTGGGRIRYLHDSTRSSIVDGYTPWYIGPGMIMPPCVIGGSGLHSIGGDGPTITIDAVPPLPVNVPGLWSSRSGQLRRRP